MAIRSQEICVEWRIFIVAIALLLRIVTAISADELPPSQARLASKPMASISKAKQAQVEQYRAQYAAEDRLIATLAKDNRVALIEDLSKGMRPPSHPSDPVPETTFQMCLHSRRLARLIEELEADPAVGKTAEAIFDEKFRELSKMINTCVESWEQGKPLQRSLPIYDQSYAVCAGLFLCMEYASLDATLKRIDQWQSFGQLTSVRLRRLTLSDAVLERLAADGKSKFVESLRKDPQHLSRLLDNDVGLCARPESLFVVNVYIRLMEKHCQLNSATGELPPYFQTRNPQVIPMWNWKSHPIASSLAHQFVIESIEEDRSLHSYTVYTGWGFLPDEQKQKLTTQVRELLERCRDRDQNPPSEK